MYIDTEFFREASTYRGFGWYNFFPTDLIVARCQVETDARFFLWWHQSVASLRRYRRYKSEVISSSNATKMKFATILVVLSTSVVISSVVISPPNVGQYSLVETWKDGLWLTILIAPIEPAPGNIVPRRLAWASRLLFVNIFLRLKPGLIPRCEKAVGNSERWTSNQEAQNFPNYHLNLMPQFGSEVQFGVQRDSKKFQLGLNDETLRGDKKEARDYISKHSCFFSNIEQTAKITSNKLLVRLASK